MNYVEIPGYILRDIRKALCSAFPSETKLAIMVQDQFGENLRNIAGGQDLSEVAFNLVEHFQAQGRLKELICGAIKQNNGNPQLQEVERKYNNLLIQSNNRNQTVNTRYSQQVAESPESTHISGSKITTIPFTFKVATIERKTKKILFGFETTELTINRHSQQNRYFAEDLGNGILLEMVKIPGGAFIMGSPKTEEGSQDRERPEHQVTVPPFFMGKYPITQVEWKAVAALPRVNRDLEPDPSHFKGIKRPVENVSWYDAVEFCARLSNHTGREYRLPSEAEWEYACRAGTTTPFHFGEKITSELANYDANYTYGNGSKGIYREKTTPVGSFQVANTFGLYDMHGNVWEWCLDDWHKNYEGAPTDGSALLSENDNLSQATGCAVLRGGSWFDDPPYCRSANRNDYGRSVGRGDIDDVIGFRVVCAFGRAFQ